MLIIFKSNLDISCACIYQFAFGLWTFLVVQIKKTNGMNHNTSISEFDILRKNFFGEVSSD